MPKKRSSTNKVRKAWLSGYPKLVAEWDARNDRLPRELSHASHYNAWWTCPRGPDHTWRASVANRVRGSGCPFCAHKRPSVTTSLAALHPKVAAEWHPTKNGARTPHDVVGGSTARVWWRCPRGADHEWQTSVRARTLLRDRACPFCTGNRVSRTNCLATVDAALAREWHPTRNGRLTPADVTKGSNRRVWWRCAARAAHVFRAAVVERATRRRACPRCAAAGRQIPR